MQKTNETNETTQKAKPTTTKATPKAKPKTEAKIKVPRVTDAFKIEALKKHKTFLDMAKACKLWLNNKGVTKLKSGVELTDASTLVQLKRIIRDTKYMDKDGKLTVGRKGWWSNFEQISKEPIQFKKIEA